MYKGDSQPQISEITLKKVQVIGSQSRIFDRDGCSSVEKRSDKLGGSKENADWIWGGLWFEVKESFSMVSRVVLEKKIYELFISLRKDGPQRKIRLIQEQVYALPLRIERSALIKKNSQR